jgi:16S rRNA processing protein RimM
MRRRSQDPSNPSSETNSGSPASGEPVYLTIGKLRRSHGLEGDMVMDILTDFPERLRVGSIVFVGDAHEPMKIVSLRGHNRQLIIRLEGFNSPEETARLRNQDLFIQASTLPKLPEGEYYHHELLGLKAVDEAGQVLGELTQILETGANDVYLIRTADGKELLLPAVEEVVLNIHLEKGEMIVRPPEYL